MSGYGIMPDEFTTLMRNIREVMGIMFTSDRVQMTNELHDTSTWDKTAATVMVITDVYIDSRSRTKTRISVNRFDLSVIYVQAISTDKGIFALRKI